MYRMVCLFLCLALVVGGLTTTYTKHNPLRDKRESTAEERMCALPPALDHGRYSPNYKRCPHSTSNAACKIVPGTLVPPGWDIYYSCDEGFNLNSTESVSYCMDGQWSPSLPQCIAGELCPPLKSQYLNINCTFQGEEVSCKQDMKPGTTATPECKTNYTKTYQTEYSYITCLNNGYWDYPLFYCTSENLCPPLKKPQNMKIVYIHHDKAVPSNKRMKPGTIAIPSCKYNYRPAYDPGYTNLTCVSGEWDQQLFYCVAVCGASNEIGLISPLIIDGVAAHVGAFPWHAGLYYRKVDKGKEIWDQKCGGSLITDQFILTAAHCVAKVKNETDIRVALGKYYRSWDIRDPTEERRNVSKILFPRQYDGTELFFDIALLVLDKKIKLGKVIIPVCHGFLDGYSYLQDKTLFVVGWGQTEHRKSSETLLYNDATIMPTEDCNRNSSHLFFDKFCARKKESGTSVVGRGDSGGGVTAVHEGLHYIFGIVSMARSDNVAYFTNITWSDNMVFVESAVQKNNKTFKWIENEFQEITNTTRCVLPSKTANIRFCSIADGCDNCDGTCVIPPGSEATTVRVTCNPGYRLRVSEHYEYSGGDVATCLSGGSWYPRIPECLKITGKKFVAGDPWNYVTWEEAKANCKAKRRRLATIKNKDQQKMLEDAADKKFNETGYDYTSIWIGLSDEIGMKGVRFAWVNGQFLKTDDFAPWRYGEPNSFEAHEDCVQAIPVVTNREGHHYTSYLWNDNNCNRDSFHFCMLDSSGYTLYLYGIPWQKSGWSQAYDNCETRGLQLAIITNQAQQEAFTASVLDRFNQTGTEADTVWIGLKAIERKFKWVDDTVLRPRHERGFTNWLPEEPNNAGHDGEPCVKAEGRRNVEPWGPNVKPFQWNDKRCSALGHYFCEDRTGNSSEKTIFAGSPFIKVTWHTAEEMCRNFARQLVTLKTLEDMDKFSKAAENFYKHETPSSIWIGLAVKNLAGSYGTDNCNLDFEWVNGQALREVGFSLWWPPEPNYPGLYENCVSASPEPRGHFPKVPNVTTYRWRDNVCLLRKFYFCSEGDSSGRHYFPGYPWIQVTWQEARENCVSEGSELAVISNQGEHDKFERAVLKQFSDEKTSPESVWIGLSSKGRPFTWVDGTPLGYDMNWLPGEPNNYQLEELCVEVMPVDNYRAWHRGAYQWNDAYCSEKNLYFCEEDTV